MSTCMVEVSTRTFREVSIAPTSPIWSNYKVIAVLFYDRLDVK